MTPTYKRNLGLIFIIVNGGYLLLVLVTGRMEGMSGVFDLFTGLHDVPTTLSRKPLAFLFGFFGHVVIALIGIKFLREGLREGPKGSV